MTGCSNQADYAVLLSGFYPRRVEERRVILRSTFLEQDYTCPWICEEHAQENEARARGLPTLDGTIYYPFTNQFSARGMSIYAPVRTWLGLSNDPEWAALPLRDLLDITPWDPTLTEPSRRCDWSGSDAHPAVRQRSEQEGGGS